MNFRQLHSNNKYQPPMSRTYFFFGAKFLFAFVLLVSPSLLAQIDNLNFDRLSLEQGLSQSNIQWILQDRYGFMWFSTQ
ncbi:MAG: hypothetical protein HYZ34_00045, partial [Ignavibacteriae bacterium]|nr:hypothetical protein [Ignavibacteriota bacterium]